MIKEFSYSFNQLMIDPLEIGLLLGYPDGILPAPFDEYLDEALVQAESLCDIRGAVFHDTHASLSGDEKFLRTNNIELSIGKTIGVELRNSESFVFIICTAGKDISEYSHELMTGDNPVLGYVFDVLGSVIVDTAADKMQKEMQLWAQSRGELITNRYSPGYCKWSVVDQHKFFSLFPPQCCGISLTDSALMHPIKSISGVFGMGKTVKYREYTCDVCTLTECFYRNTRKSKMQ